MTKNKIFNTAIIVLVVSIAIVSLMLIYKNFNNKNEEIIIPNLVMDVDEINISKNNSTSLLAYVSNVDNAKIQWFSSNLEIATVNDMGQVQGINYGSTKIVARYIHVDGKIYMKHCKVNVIDGDPNVSISSVSFLDGELVITKDQEYNLKFNLEPANALITSVKYSSNNSNIVNINNDGVIKGISNGRTSVKVLVNNQYSSEFFINVIDGNNINEIVHLPDTLKFNEETLTIEVGEELNLPYEILPINSNIKYLTWNSSNMEVANVNNGVIKGIKEGNTTITLTSLNGVSDYVNVTVIPKQIPVESVNISCNNINLKIGETTQVSHQIHPINATNQEVKYTSSNPDVATVDANGLVTTKKGGLAIITVTTMDGNKTSSINITVVGTSSSGNSSGSSGSSSGSSGGSSGSSYPNSGGASSCGKSAQTLIMTYNGSRVNKDEVITIKKGQSITIKVSLPSSCGSPELLKRNNADGQDGWRDYITASSSPYVNRYDISTAKRISSYSWNITGKKVTNGNVILSQTAEFSTSLYGNIKAMTRVRIKVTN